MPQSASVDPQRMTCMEIWGGNSATDQMFEAPGADIYVHNQPFQASQDGGGDIYYLTSCASGRISRMLLADVSGHGAAVAALANKLKELLRSNVNKISQQQFVSQMNVEIGELMQSDGFATAVVATFFEPRRSLEISVAGHPYPLYFESANHSWVQLDPEEYDVGLENLPLGINDSSVYHDRKLVANQGDMLLMYSDAYSEARDDQGKLLSIEGLLQILNDGSFQTPENLIPRLRERIGEMAQPNLADDDATLLLCHFTSNKVRMRDNLLAPIRLLSSVADNTRLKLSNSDDA